MSGTKHTPGPWRVEANRSAVYVLAGNFCVATTADERTGNVAPAADNARLIAAAPELLEALTDAAHRIRYLLQFNASVIGENEAEDVSAELSRWEAVLAKAHP